MSIYKKWAKEERLSRSFFLFKRKWRR